MPLIMPITHKKPELMCPIRDWASLEACMPYADAVYFGVPVLTMRANANTIKISDLPRFVKKCHSKNIKAYLTINSVVYNEGLKKAENLILKAKKAGVDAVILWDPAVMALAKKHKQKFFVSTQANISNWQSVLVYKKLGASRVVLARELNLKQIKEIKRKVGKYEIETFVHGAMCMSISGRCLLSSYLYGKSANCGACAQPCRKEWILSDNEGNKLVTTGKSFLSAKDLCMIEHVPELIKSGIDSFKIEGRRRDPRYIETTARCYREAIDAYFDNTLTKDKIADWKKKLETTYNRGFSTGFYFGEPGADGISFDKADNLSQTKKILVGKILHYYPKIKVAELDLKHRGLKIGDEIVVEGQTSYLNQKIDSMQIDNKNITRAGKGKKIAIKTNKRVRENDLVFNLCPTHSK